MSSDGKEARGAGAVKGHGFSFENWRARGWRIVCDQPPRKPFQIAHVYEHGQAGQHAARARAQVIAAAPDLLTAAKELCFQMLKTGTESEVPAAAWDAMQDAIAKAEGAEPISATPQPEHTRSL